MKAGADFLVDNWTNYIFTFDHGKDLQMQSLTKYCRLFSININYLTNQFLAICFQKLKPIQNQNMVTCSGLVTVTKQMQEQDLDMCSKLRHDTLET